MDCAANLLEVCGSLILLFWISKDRSDVIWNVDHRKLMVSLGQKWTRRQWDPEERDGGWLRGRGFGFHRNLKPLGLSELQASRSPLGLGMRLWGIALHLAREHSAASASAQQHLKSIQCRRPALCLSLGPQSTTLSVPGVLKVPLRWWEPCLFGCDSSTACFPRWDPGEVAEGRLNHCQRYRLGKRAQRRSWESEWVSKEHPSC